MPSAFDQLVSEYPALEYLDRVPARSRYSDARVLDPETAIVTDCEPEDCRRLFREWPDRRTAEELAEAVHQLELERAAQPPVIEVTVTTPPGGIPRLELERVVAEKVREITMPRTELSAGPWRPRRVLIATSRARDRLARDSQGRFCRPPEPALPGSYVSEDDTPTEVIPAIRDYLPAIAEVRVP